MGDAIPARKLPTRHCPLGDEFGAAWIAAAGAPETATIAAPRIVDSLNDRVCLAV